MKKLYKYDSSIPIFTNETFIATEFFTPKNIENNVCTILSKSQWKFCTKQFNKYNNLFLVNTFNSFIDNCKNHRGSFYNSSHVFNIQHKNSVPEFNNGKTIKYNEIAVGFTPYGHLTDSHLYASTLPWILQLLKMLPSHVPILVYLSKKHERIFNELGLPMHRFVTLDKKTTIFSKTMYSFITLPVGTLEPLGRPSFKLLHTRILGLPFIKQHFENRIVYLSRRNKRVRHLVNEDDILKRIDMKTFVHSSKYTLTYLKNYFQSTKVLFGPHGGAMLNMIFCNPGTKILEVGYDDKIHMPYPSYFFTMANRLNHEFSFVIGKGSYKSNIVAPVDKTIKLLKTYY